MAVRARLRPLLLASICCLAAYFIYYYRGTLLLILVGLLASASYYDRIPPITSRTINCAPLPAPQPRRSSADFFEPPELASESLIASIKQLASRIRAKFIDQWFVKISQDRWFASEVEYVVYIAIGQLSKACERVRWPELAIKAVLPAIVAHVEAYRRTVESLQDRNALRKSQDSEEVADLIVATLQSHSRLHSAISNYSGWALPRAQFLISLGLQSHELSQSAIATEFLEDIVGHAVLGSVLNLLDKPDFWNQQLIKVSERALQNQERVERIRRGVTTTIAAKELPLVAVDTQSEEYSRILDTISLATSPSALRRLIFSINAQLQKLIRSEIDRPTKKYKERLVVSKRAAEVKLRELAPHSLMVDERYLHINLDRVLGDSQATTYFLQFLAERQDPSLDLFLALGRLDTGAIDPLGGLLMSSTTTDSEVKTYIHQAVELWGQYETQLRKYLDQVQITELASLQMEPDLKPPSETVYINLHRTFSDVRVGLIARLQNKLLPQFRDSSYFLEYVESLEASQGTTDRLQTEDIAVASDSSQSGSETVLGVVDEILSSESFQPEVVDDCAVDLTGSPRKAQDGRLVGRREDVIARLDRELQLLEKQRAVVEKYRRKAVVTDNQLELNLLTKVVDNIDAEFSNRRTLRDQLGTFSAEVSLLYGRASIRVDRAVQQTDQSGEYTAYIISISMAHGSSFAVSRRYSQFYELHRILRREFAVIDEFEFPKKRVVVFSQRQAIQERLHQFDSYLSLVLSHPQTAQHPAFRVFLASDEFPAAFYELGDLASRPSASNSEPRKESAKPQSDEGLVKPILRAAETLFGMDERQDWLRGRVLGIVLQQVLGGRIEKKIRDSFDDLGERLPALIDDLAQNLRTDAEMAENEPAPPATASDRIAAQQLAKQLWRRVIVGWAGRVTGPQNANRAADAVFECLQNETLNRHLILTIIDKFLDELR